ncbi:MAG: preprotein translocase subunit SecE [Vicinamibacteria bacterium]|nr:preprotein translocase subunit SecE [Vicinamibacteria bacterium]
MAVAEAKMVDKSEEPGSSSAVSNAVSYVPRKFAELREFLTEVKSELKKVTWPSQDEVRGTTLVVIATTFFFGFYLYGMDLGFSWVLSYILK